MQESCAGLKNRSHTGPVVNFLLGRCVFTSAHRETVTTDAMPQQLNHERPLFGDSRMADGDLSVPGVESDRNASGFNVTVTFSYA